MNKNGKTNGLPRGSRSLDGFTVSPVRPARTVVRRPVQLQARPRSYAVAPPVTGQAVVPIAAAAPPTVPEPVEPKYYALPAYRAPERPSRPLRKRVSKTMLVLRLSSAVVALFLLTGGFLAWRGYSNVHRVFHGTETVAALQTTKVAPQLLKGEGDGRVNIVLLGIGGPGHDGADLTDTIMILSVDPVNNTATMLSIPRDLWVKMPNSFISNYQKINAAYESGKYQALGRIDASNANAPAIQAGFDAVDTTLSTVLNIPISYHVLVNFQAFRQAVDTVRGVTVNVPTPLIDPTMAWENNNNPVLAAAGVQQMNGVQALLYARSRETTSDFARAERQRQIMVALKDKILTAGTLSNPAKISNLLNAFGSNVYSDMSVQAAMRLVTIMRRIGDGKITSVSLDNQPTPLVTTDHVGTISVVRPTAGFNNYTAIQNYVHSQLTDSYLAHEQAKVSIMSATASGAATLTSTLKAYGYNVSSSTTLSRPTTGTTVVDLSQGKDPYTRHYLEQRFGVSAVTSMPAGVNLVDLNAAFVIISDK